MEWSTVTQEAGWIWRLIALAVDPNYEQPILRGDITTQEAPSLSDSRHS
jgi:hypothetical protein